jgi:hypothetical protein
MTAVHSLQTKVLPISLERSRLHYHTNGRNGGSEGSPFLVRLNVRSGLVITGHLDKILVGIPEVDGLNWTRCSGSSNRSFEDFDFTSGQLRDYFGKGSTGHEADIGRSRCRVSGLGLEFAPGLMKIYLLSTERQRPTAAAERNNLHTKDTRIEVATGLDASNCQHHMVDSVDPHPLYRRVRSNAGLGLDLHLAGTRHRNSRPEARHAGEGCVVMGGNLGG